MKLSIELVQLSVLQICITYKYKVDKVSQSSLPLHSHTFPIALPTTGFHGKSNLDSAMGRNYYPMPGLAGICEFLFRQEIIKAVEEVVINWR